MPAGVRMVQSSLSGQRGSGALGEDGMDGGWSW